MHIHSMFPLAYLDASSKARLACCARACYWAIVNAKDASADLTVYSFLLVYSDRPTRWGKCCLEMKVERHFFLALKQRYDMYIETSISNQAGLELNPTAGTPAIPRIIHHIWLGNPAPGYLTQFRATWQRFHPADQGWQYCLWTERGIARAFPDGLRNQAAFDAARNYGEKSDILRYEVLYRYGGLYVDADMECLRSLADLHSPGGLTFYAGLSNTGTIEINNGLVGSAPGHPLLAHLVQTIYQTHQAELRNPPPPPSSRPSRGGLKGILNFLSQDHRQAVQNTLQAADRDEAAMRTIERTGPWLFTRSIAQLMLQSNSETAQSLQQHTLIVPPQWLNPVPNTARSNQGGKDFIVPASRAVHHWKCSWRK